MMGNGVRPTTDNLEDLGSVARRWATLYAVALHNGTLTAQISDLVTAASFAGSHDASLTAHSSVRNVANGLCGLDASAKVPSAQLPAYVDDVLEYANLAAFPGTGIDGIIYIALDTNLCYRWSGSIYVEISPSLALGETSATAYRGDRGKTAYNHSQATGNPHSTTAANIGLGTSDTPQFAGVGLGAALTSAELLRLEKVHTATSGSVYGRYALVEVNHANASGTTILYSDYALARTHSSHTGRMTALIGQAAYFNHQAGSIVASTGYLAALIAGGFISATGTIATVNGLRIPVITNTGGATITTMEALRLSQQTVGSTIYQIHSLGGVSLLEAGTDVTPLILKGMATQSADLFSVRSSADAVLAAIGATGAIRASSIMSGLGTDVDVYFYANNGDANKPGMRYSAADNKWQFSNDGTTWTDFGGGTIPVKASGAEADTGTDDAKFLTPKAVNDSHNIPSVAPGTSGNVLTSNGTDWTSAAPSGGGATMTSPLYELAGWLGATATTGGGFVDHGASHGPNVAYYVGANGSNDEVWVANWTAENIEVINTLTMAVVQTISMTGYKVYRMQKVGSYVYCLCENSSDSHPHLRKIAIATYTADALNLDWAADTSMDKFSDLCLIGTVLYASMGDRVKRITTSNDTVTHTSSTGYYSQARGMATDGSRLWLCGGGTYCYELNPADLSYLWAFEHSATANSEVQYDGHGYIWVADPYNGNLDIFDIANSGLSSPTVTLSMTGVEWIIPDGVNMWGVTTGGALNRAECWSQSIPGWTARTLAGAIGAGCVSKKALWVPIPSTEKTYRIPLMERG